MNTKFSREIAIIITLFVRKEKGHLIHKYLAYFRPRSKVVSIRKVMKFSDIFTIHES
jgi:hypothetical protein